MSFCRGAGAGAGRGLQGRGRHVAEVCEALTV